MLACFARPLGVESKIGSISPRKLRLSADRKNILKCIEHFFDISCQSKDVALEYNTTFISIEKTGRSHVLLENIS